MSYISDMYKFTREIDRYIKEKSELPKVGELNTIFSDKYLKGNRRRMEKVATSAMSGEYGLVSIEGRGHFYSLGLKGYDIVKGIPYFRPWLVLLFISELNTYITVFLSLSALIVSLLVAIYK